MKKIRFYIAMLAAKLSLFALKVLGRNASFLPGKIALTISKDFIGHLTPPETVIAVTGTNGKTTVSNLITSVLKENGYDVTNNSLGSNVQAGVATVLLQDSTFTGKAKKKIAVLEVDERSSLRIYPYMTPDYLICNNIMRDSLARNAHTEFISFIINKALPESTKVILNADDMVWMWKKRVRSVLFICRISCIAPSAVSCWKPTISDTTTLADSTALPVTLPPLFRIM